MLEELRDRNSEKERHLGADEVMVGWDAMWGSEGIETQEARRGKRGRGRAEGEFGSLEGWRCSLLSRVRDEGT